MAKTKREKEYTFLGFGFPVIIRNVPMIMVRDEWMADVNWNHMEVIVLITLAYKQDWLTGDQIRFIRVWANLNQRDFAKEIGVAQTAVHKWETFGDRPATMRKPTQRLVRMFVLMHLKMTDEKLAHAMRAVYGLELYETAKILKVDFSQPGDEGPDSLTGS